MAVLNIQMALPVILVIFLLIIGGMNVAIGTAIDKAIIQFFSQCIGKSTAPLFTSVNTADIITDVRLPIVKPNNTLVYFTSIRIFSPLLS